MKRIYYLFIVLMAMSMRVNGQDDEQDMFELSLEELMNIEIVTAGKTDQKISDVPASIVVITREDIETYGYNKIDDLIADIPGFYSTGVSNFYGGTNYGVRGFSSPGSAFNNVMILVNGVNQMQDFSNSYSTDRITVPIQSIDRVEVVRGPMAVVYGSSAFMGVINIITNDVPDEGTTSMVSLTRGSLNTNEIFSKLAGKSGDFQYSFNGAITTSDGLDLNYIDLQSNPLVLGAFGVDPAATTKNQLTSDNKYFNFSGKFKNFIFSMDYSDHQQGMIGVLPSLNYDKGWLGDIKGSNVHAAYTLPLVSDKIEVVAKFTNSDYSYGADDLHVLAPNQFMHMHVATTAQEYELNTFLNLSEQLKINVGLYDRHVSKLEQTSDIALLGLNNVQTFITDKHPLNTFAVFAQLDFSPIDKLKLVVGARAETTQDYIIEAKEMDSLNQWTPSWNRETSIGDLQFIPRFAAIYSPNDNHVVKFIYSQSTKRPSYVQLMNNFDANGNGLDFANMTTYELNCLTTLGGRVSLNTSLYYNQLTDLIVRTIDVSSGSVVTNSSNNGKATTTGAELTMKAEIIDNLKAEVSYTYQNTTDHTAGMDEVDFSFAPSSLAYFKLSYNINDSFKFGLRGRCWGNAC